MLKKDASSLQRPLAKTMVVFMFKGLFTNIALPYAQFAASSITGADMFPFFWKVIERLTRVGCQVLAVTSDGGSPNRRLFQLHNFERPSCLQSTKPFFGGGTRSHVFHRPPHLLKTICNCFQSPTRSLWVSDLRLLYCYHILKYCILSIVLVQWK